MKRITDRISTHAVNDDWRLYEFTRDSKLPYGTFGRRRSPDAIVFSVCMVLLALGLLAANIGQ